MKTNINPPLFFFVASWLLPCITLAQQPVNPAVKYTYDAAGNRIKREKVPDPALLVVNPNNNPSEQQTAKTDAMTQDKSKPDADNEETMMEAKKEILPPNSTLGTSEQSMQDISSQFNKSENKNSKPDAPTQTLRVKIFPNPTRGKLFITTNTPVTHLEVINALGEQVYNSTNKQIHQSAIIDISSYIRGVYFLRIEAEQESWVERVVVE